MVTIEKLIENLPTCEVFGSKDLKVNGITSHSKKVLPGYLFIAKKGKRVSGAIFLKEAIAAGAIVIVVDHFDSDFSNITQVVHPDPAAIEGFLAAAFYFHPSCQMVLIGITGTNGKTTTSYIIKHLLDQSCSRPSGLIGTVEYDNGRDRYPSTLTTPDAIDNHRMLHEMLENGCKHAVMEVSSIGIDQKRLDGIMFNVAVYTNLSQDHLDYHQTMENYCLVKNRFFREFCDERNPKLSSGSTVVNHDCPWTPKILAGHPRRHMILTYGIDSSADLMATDIRYLRGETRATISLNNQSYGWLEKVSMSWPLVGKFNVYNCLAAIGALRCCGHSLEKIAPMLLNLPQIKGRLERVSNDLGINIYIDYAHSEDALCNALKTLREVHPEGRLVVVFGCGGDRDHDKRPKMARACEEYADFVVLTSDNPRTEDPIQICRDATQGFSNQEKYHIELDRRLAIEWALNFAKQRDTVLIAGKGHEKTQIIGDQVLDFDDSKVAAEMCKAPDF